MAADQEHHEVRSGRSVTNEDLSFDEYSTKPKKKAEFHTLKHIENLEATITQLRADAEIARNRLKELDYLLPKYYTIVAQLQAAKELSVWGYVSNVIATIGLGISAYQNDATTKAVVFAVSVSLYLTSIGFTLIQRRATELANEASSHERPTSPSKT